MRLWDHQEADYLRVGWWEKALPRCRELKGTVEEKTRTHGRSHPHTHRGHSCGKGNKAAEGGSPALCDTLSWTAIRAQTHLLNLESGATLYVNVSERRRRAALLLPFIPSSRRPPLPVAAAQRSRWGTGSRGRSGRRELHWAAQGPVSVSARGRRTPGPAADNTVIVLLWGLGLLCADYSFITPGSPAEL